MEKTLLLLKPDSLQRNLIGEIISRFEKKGLQLVGLKMIQLDDDILNSHYVHLSDKPFFPRIKDFMKSTPIIACCWQGLDAVNVVRRMCGITKAREAEQGTIRGDLGLSVQCNLVHASDSIESAITEVDRFFRDFEIFNYQLNNFNHIYANGEV